MKTNNSKGRQAMAWYMFVGGCALAGAVLIGAISMIPGSSPVQSALPSRILSAIGMTAEPDKLGWLDDAELTPSDIARVAALKGKGSGSDGMHLLHGGINRRDFELLRQDRRRTQAAYPNVKTDDLFYGAWMPVSEDAKIPDSWCTSGNSHGTQGRDGKWYLDGGCYMSLVRPQFTERASVADTKLFLAIAKEAARQKRLVRLREEGPFAWWGGSGGSMSVRLDKTTNMVVVERAKEWANKGTKWTFPFVVEEWTDINASDLEAIKALPSFVQAATEEVDVTPSGVTIGSFTSTGRAFNGTLMPGDGVTTSVQMQR